MNPMIRTVEQAQGFVACVCANFKLSPQLLHPEKSISLAETGLVGLHLSSACEFSMPDMLCSACRSSREVLIWGCYD